MITIGITGGIGSGKSYISNLLRQRGILVFDCDTEAKKLTIEDRNIRQQLQALLGEEVYTNTGVNKQMLATYLFASKDNAARVNAIIHPVVRQAFRDWVIKCKSEGYMIVAMESAILFESGFDSEVDKVLMVHAPQEIRCLRVMQRDHASIDEVKKRIASQYSDEEKIIKSDFVIENDGVQSLDNQLDKLFSTLNNIKAGK